jgi:leucine dehydrogenase
MFYPKPTELKISGYERVIRFDVPELRLKGFIAIHNTLRGPALGGTRLWDYNDESLALKDVLRLAEGMTYKASAAQLPLGGGKAVIIGNPNLKSREFFQAYGHYVASLQGRYITAEDINTNTDDMEAIFQSTRYVVGRQGQSGNPSPWTALGAFKGIQSSIHYVWKNRTLSQCSFAIQGVGATGIEVLHHLVQAGAQSIAIADINEKNVLKAKQKYPWLKIVTPDQLLFEKVDVLIPCALGGILNQHSIPKIKAKIIAGTANNLLANYETDHHLIQQQGILLAPDFIINAGGLIQVSKEITQETEVQTLKRMEQIGPRLISIYQLAETKKISTFEAAMNYAKQFLK